MTDTDVGKEIYPETLIKLKEIGFDVTVIVAAYLRNDGTRQDVKKLIYERESTHDLFIEHLTEVHNEVPEIITEAEVDKMIEKQEENPVSFTDENAVVPPTSIVLRIEVNLDSSQDLAFIFSAGNASGERRRRWSWFKKKVQQAKDTVVVVKEGWKKIKKIWGRK